MHDIISTMVGRADDETPTSLTIIKENLVSIVINTPTFENEFRDGWKIRRLAHDNGTAVISSTREADALLKVFSSKINVYKNIEVAGHATAITRIALPRQADARAVFNPCRHAH